MAGEQVASRDAPAGYNICRCTPAGASSTVRDSSSSASVRSIDPASKSEGTQGADRKLRCSVERADGQTYYAPHARS